MSCFYSLPPTADVCKITLKIQTLISFMFKMSQTIRFTLPAQLLQPLARWGRCRQTLFMLFHIQQIIPRIYSSDRANAINALKLTEINFILNP